MYHSTGAMENTHVPPIAYELPKSVTIWDYEFWPQEMKVQK